MYEHNYLAIDNPVFILSPHLNYTTAHWLGIFVNMLEFPVFSWESHNNFMEIRRNLMGFNPKSMRRSLAQNRLNR